MNELYGVEEVRVLTGYEFFTHTQSHGVRVTYQTAEVSTDGEILSIHHDSGRDGRIHTLDGWDFESEAISFFRNLIEENPQEFAKMRDRVNSKWKAAMERIRAQKIATAAEKYNV